MEYFHILSRRLMIHLAQTTGESGGRTKAGLVSFNPFVLFGIVLR